LEQALFQTLQTWRSRDPLHRRLHFWRDRSGRQVDFILQQDGKLVAIEVKAGSIVNHSDSAGIRAFREALGKKVDLVRGVVLHAARSLRWTPASWPCPGAGWCSNELITGHSSLVVAGAAAWAQLPVSSALPAQT